MQEAVEAAQDSGKYSEDEAKSFILQNEGELKNDRTKKRPGSGPQIILQQI